MDSKNIMDTINNILEIEKACFDNPWTFEMLSFEINNPLGVLTYEVRDGRIVCYAVGHVVAGEGELTRLGTLPEYRRMGLADKVMTDFLAAMKERSAEKCFLEVRSRNAPAVSLYEKHGFEQVGLRKKYYGDDDALVMSADFTIFH